jgi:coenzyme F420-reducing hydrogenase beta subunit
LSVTESHQPLFLKKYIDWLERENGKKVLNISFRDKKFGWEDYQVVIKFEDGSEIRRYHYLDPFFKGYLSNFYLRNSCYKCEFCRIPRLSDITLGDFWGAPEKLRDQKGVSLVIVNSIIGQKMLGTLLQLGRIKLVEVTLKTATKRNPRIITGEYKIPDKRGLIIRQARELAFEDIIKYFEHTPPNKRIYKIRKIIIKCLKCILSLRLCVREE